MVGEGGWIVRCICEKFERCGEEHAGGIESDPQIAGEDDVSFGDRGAVGGKVRQAGGLVRQQPGNEVHRKKEDDQLGGVLEIQVSRKVCTLIHSVFLNR
jgi:hypothetical protein